MSNHKQIRKHLAAVERRNKKHMIQERWGALFSMGWRVAFEWGMGMFVGYLLGYFIDKLAGTHPWGMITCLLFSNIAGLFNIYRTYRNDYKTF